MKKFLLILLAVTALYGCEKKENPPINSDSSEVQQETFQPDPHSVRTSTSVSGTSATTTQTVNSYSTQTTTAQNTTVHTISTTTTTATVIPQNSQQQPDPLGGGAFSYDENGALQFIENPETDNDHLMIAAAQALFESACRTQWIFTVGCPYNLDMDSVIQNGFGWTYYKITDENINSLADVENVYYSVFSDRYPNEDLKMLYLEFEGAVYALNGQREMNLYYSVSRITGIQSYTDDEIFFTVENQFEGTDMKPDEPYSQEETFSMVLDDNKIRVGQFRLPY